MSASLRRQSRPRRPSSPEHMHASMNIPDRRVFDRPTTDQDTQEFVRFYESGKPRVFYHALSLVGDHTIAEDLTHDAFLRLLAEIKDGNAVNSVIKWTHRVLRNLALNYLEHSRVVLRNAHPCAEGWDETVPHQGRSVEQELIAREQYEVLRGVLEDLLPAERECILLFAEGSSFQHIADRQQLSYGVAVATVRRGLRKVRKGMAASGH